MPNFSKIICPLSLRDTETRHESRPALRGSPSRMSMGHTGIILIFLLIFSASCRPCGSKKALIIYKNNIELQTSSLEIIKKYGLAQQRWRDESGNNIFSYTYSKPKYGIFSFLPIPLFYSKFDNYEVILTFDDSGNLADVKKFHDRIKMKSWVICEPQVADCDLGYEVIGRK